MWASILGLVSKLLEIFFPSKSSDKVAHDDGESQGIAEQKAAAAAGVIHDVQTAKDAAQSVDAGLAGSVPVTETDGFRRD